MRAWVRLVFVSEDVMAIACPDCGTIQELPPLPPSGIALCEGCEDRLERTAGRSLVAALACALATGILLFPANLLPLMSVSMAGAERQSVLGSGILTLWDQGWFLLAIPLGLFGIAFPLLRFWTLAIVLGVLRLGYCPTWLGPGFRLATRLDLWAMPDVFLIGCLVGYSRVVAFIPVRIGAGGWCFFAAALLSMVTHAALDRRSVWRRIAPERELPEGIPAISCTCCDLLLPISEESRRCPRCGARIYARKPNSTMRTTALVLAGFVLYGPANLYPMSNLVRFGDVRGRTIYAGIEELIHAHLWPLAILIFMTSISIPVLKLVGLTWFLVSIRRRTARGLVARTKLHRVIDAVGRWSNIDVFTIAVFAPLMQFGQLATVHAGRGAVAFLAVVVLTMIASRAFDPRLMWDAAERRS